LRAARLNPVCIFQTGEAAMNAKQIASPKIALLRTFDLSRAVSLISCCVLYGFFDFASRFLLYFDSPHPDLVLNLCAGSAGHACAGYPGPDMNSFFPDSPAPAQFAKRRTG
jgi:hypothetical protein